MEVGFIVFFAFCCLLWCGYVTIFICTSCFYVRVSLFNVRSLAFAAIRSNMEQYVAIWSDIERYDTMWFSAVYLKISIRVGHLRNKFWNFEISQNIYCTNFSIFCSVFSIVVFFQLVFLLVFFNVIFFWSAYWCF